MGRPYAAIQRAREKVDAEADRRRKAEAGSDSSEDWYEEVIAGLRQREREWFARPKAERQQILDERVRKIKAYELANLKKRNEQLRETMQQNRARANQNRVLEQRD